MKAPSRHAIFAPGQPGEPPIKPTQRQTHQLLHVLTRERSRIDRCGGVLALVVFYVPRPWWGNRRRMRRLVEVLKHRLRITDEVGLIDGQRAFALLPDTNALGAEILARQVQRHLSEEGLFFSFAVFRYVSGRFDQASGSGDDHDQNRSSDDHADHNNGSNNKHGTGNNGDANRNGSSNGQPRGPRLVDGHPTGNGDAIASPGRVARRSGNGEAIPEPEACVMYNFPHRLPWWKRGLDIAIASTALVAVSPILLLASVAIKLESPGPVLFTQLRTGAGRRPFRIFKFRTMADGAEKLRDELLSQNEQDGPAFKMNNDPRVTRVGAVLRATSVDELPQLLNILRGEMTMVGPRPLPVHEADGCEGWQDARHNVHPGLTCIWQVKGRSRVSFEDWARMDLRYIRKRTLWRDLKIIAATVPAVLKRDGAC